MPSSSQPAQRVWVVTGASSGFGLAIASYILSKGDKVIATVRSLNRFPQSLRDQGAQPLVLDLSSSDNEIKHAAESALQVYGQVDVLVNNAGWGAPSPWEEADLGEVKAQFQTLFFGTIAFTQPFLPYFRQRRAGHIINISSQGSILAAPSWGAYCAAKAALNVFTDTLHAELKLFGVQVLAIAPGYFPTSFMGSANGKTSDKLSQIYTDPSQGYDGARAIHQNTYDAGLLGDANKLAARIFEVVTRTGLAENLVTEDDQGSDLTFILLGADSGDPVRKKLEARLASVNATEPIWRSVVMDIEKQRLIPRDVTAL